MLRRIAALFAVTLLSFTLTAHIALASTDTAPASPIGAVQEFVAGLVKSTEAIIASETWRQRSPARSPSLPTRPALRRPSHRTPPPRIRSKRRPLQFRPRLLPHRYQTPRRRLPHPGQYPHFPPRNRPEGPPMTMSSNSKALSRGSPTASATSRRSLQRNPPPPRSRAKSPPCNPRSPRKD
jgi:hypothetical protein